MDWFRDLENGTEHPTRSSRVYQSSLKEIKTSGNSGRLIWPICGLDMRLNNVIINSGGNLIIFYYITVSVGG